MCMCMALSAEDKAEVVTIVTGSIKPFADQLAPLAKLGEQVAALGTQIGEMKKASETPKPDPKAEPKKDEPKGDDPIAGVTKLLTELTTQVKTLADERAGEKAQRELDSLIESTLKSEKRGGLLNNPLVMDHIRAAKPKNADEVKAALNGAKQRIEASGFKIDDKTWGADPVKEGATPGSGSGGSGKALDMAQLEKDLKTVATV